MSHATDPAPLFAQLPAKPETDWRGFLKIADSLAPEDLKTRVFFRGEADATWPHLEPSLTRTFPRNALSLERALELECMAVLRFQKVAHMYINPAILPNLLNDRYPHKLRGEKLHNWWRNAIDWWAYMQQHLTPTRLLDWTRSVFVAAYFSVASHFEKDGRIWCCDKETLDRYMQAKFSRGGYLSHLFPALQDSPDRSQEENEREYNRAYNANDVFFLDMLRQSERQAVQQACFMMCKNPLADLKPLLEEAGCLCEIVIPANQKPLFLERLGAMNITSHSLFPGIDGLGRSIGVWMSAVSRSIGNGA